MKDCFVCFICIFFFREGARKRERERERERVREIALQLYTDRMTDRCRQKEADLSNHFFRIYFRVCAKMRRQLQAIYLCLGTKKAKGEKLGGLSGELNIQSKSG